MIDPMEGFIASESEKGEKEEWAGRGEVSKR
jgi:hypothetical protein